MADQSADSLRELLKQEENPVLFLLSQNSHTNTQALQLRAGPKVNRGKSLIPRSAIMLDNKPPCKTVPILETYNKVSFVEWSVQLEGGVKRFTFIARRLQSNGLE